MSVARPDDVGVSNPSPFINGPPSRRQVDYSQAEHAHFKPSKGDPPRLSRRTPRKSVVVVVPENHILSEVVADQLPISGDEEMVDIIVACAGEPADLGFLTGRIRDVQVLLAPAGTSSQRLRELGISQAPGDIVTMLEGSALPASSEPIVRN